MIDLKTILWPELCVRNGCWCLDCSIFPICLKYPSSIISMHDHILFISSLFFPFFFWYIFDFSLSVNRIGVQSGHHWWLFHRRCSTTNLWKRLVFLSFSQGLPRTLSGRWRWRCYICFIFPHPLNPLYMRSIISNCAHFLRPFRSIRLHNWSIGSGQ